MIRAGLDTNVLASGLAAPDATPGMVLACWAGQLFELVTSEHILAELERTLAKDYFRRSIPIESVPGMIVRVLEGSSITSISAQVIGIATHPEDDFVLATAVSGNAQFLVTGDRQLLKLQEHEGIRIVDAAEFLQVLIDEQKDESIL